ncbi:hypothetical protein NW762_006554 [Fusarium torreyae]|uniref:Uncharacterized protein n=1 Tax=Fusarium torreyae TaxID=1237075 RepID=A0A9W8VEY1_9HYPO|nr:hypothetical protein NW762_006554 [Fusarium torreyae]
MEPPAIPPVTDVPPTPALELEFDPMPVPLKRGRPPGSRNKKGTKKSRMEAQKAAAARGLSAEDKKAQKELKGEEKRREKAKKELEERTKSLNDDFPTIENIDFMRRRHPQFGHRWTEDEDALAYTSSLAHEQIEDLASDIRAKKRGDYSRLTTLWKVCLRVFRCSPFELLSPRHNLDFLPVTGPKNDSPAVWNQTFCDELSHIITHNVWDGEVASLRAALQYAVICRTDDRRRWIMPPLELESGPLILYHRRYIRCTAMRVREDLPGFVARYRTSSCRLARQLRKKSKRASRWSKPPKLSANGFSVYGVSIVDLRTVRRAIDSLQRVGNRVHPSTELCYEEFLKARKTHDDPPEFNGLADFNKRAWLHEQRQMVRAKAVDGEVGTGVEVDGQVGSRLSSSEVVHISSDSDSALEDDAMDVDGLSLGGQVPQTQDSVDLGAADVEMPNDGRTSALDNIPPMDDEDENRSEILSSIHVVLRSESPDEDGGPSELASPTLATCAIHGSETPSGKGTPVLGSPTLSTR